MGLLLFLLGLKAISRRVTSQFRCTRLTVTLFFGTALQLLLRALLALCGVALLIRRRMARP